MANDTPPRARRNGGQAGGTRRRDEAATRAWSARWPRAWRCSAMFDAEHRQWSLDEMVARLGVSRMTAYRMARTLQGTGHLVHDPAVGGYRLGPGHARGHLPRRGLRAARGGRPPVSREADEGDGRARRPRRGARRRGRVRRPRGVRAPLRARDRRGEGHRRHGERARQDVRGDEAGRRARADRQAAAPSAHASSRSPIRPSWPPSSTRSAARASRSTSRSTTSARAPSSRPCATRPATSSPRWASSSPPAASARRSRVACADAVRETAASLSEYCGYARSDQGLDRIT